MKPWQRLLALGLVVAACSHLLTVWAAPRLIMREAMARIAKESTNGVYLPPPTDHTQRRIVMPSPDLLYATCAADLSKQPLRVSAEVAHPRYWSVALYGANSDNFFVVNDRKVAARSADAPSPLELLVIAPGTDRAALSPPPGATIVEAPSAKVLLLMRLLVTDEGADLASAERARQSLRCQPALAAR
jgi:uncharacterized membrane protein